MNSQVVCATSAEAERTSSCVAALSSVPSTHTDPPLGSRLPASIAMSVDLPAPEGPTTARLSPRRTLRFTPSSTGSASQAASTSLSTMAACALAAGEVRAVGRAVELGRGRDRILPMARWLAIPPMPT